MRSDAQNLLGESQLAPSTFSEFVGQDRIKHRLQIAIDAAKQKNESVGHILLIGPHDFGKATLAKIIRKAIGAKTTVLSGLTCGSFNDFAGLLTNLDEGDVLFIDGVQALERRAAAFLCQPMKDLKMDVIIDQGANARAVQLNLPHFTLIGTAPDTQRMLPAFLSSFNIVDEMDPYTRIDLTTLTCRFAEKMGLALNEGVPEQIVQLSCVSPRDVLNRLRHIQDYAHVKAPHQPVTYALAYEALKMLTPMEAQGNRPQVRSSGIVQELLVDPLKRRYQVFLSSTYEDLKDERRHVLQALLETKCIPTGMELFPAANEDQWQLIKRVIDDCDYYIVVIAGRYGTIGPSGKSYTEMEFDYAVSTGKSVIGFYHSDLESLPGARLERTDERRAKLAAFTEKVKRRMCKPWTTPDGLASAIKSAILHSIENDRQPGWIRASDLPSTAAIAKLKESITPHDDKRPRSESKQLIEVPVTVTYFEVETDQNSLPPPKRIFNSLRLAPDELFLILGPRLSVKRPRRTLKMYLEKLLDDRVKASIPLTPGKHLKRFSWDLGFENLEKILDIFVAEKIVKIVRPPQGLSTKALYWEITPKGQQRLAELRVASS
jgi:Holliday junction resolvasome RuvABC ATP-dependent DNA helicase subunit